MAVVWNSQEETPPPQHHGVTPLLATIPLAEVVRDDFFYDIFDDGSTHTYNGTLVEIMESQYEGYALDA